jgi:hypothetical protein
VALWKHMLKCFTQILKQKQRNSYIHNILSCENSQSVFYPYTTKRFNGVVDILTVSFLPILYLYACAETCQQKDTCRVLKKYVDGARSHRSK